jgi:hypothetical protein
MTRYTVLSRQTHAMRTWKRPENYRFAASDQAVLLVAEEAAAASCEMPFGFVRQGESLEMAAVCGLTPGNNVYVAPTGQWMMRYIPLILRGHPFHHMRQPNSDQALLCVDEDSECLQGDGTETFFDEDSAPSAAVLQAIKLHTYLDAARSATRLAIAALTKANALVPWRITAQIGQQVTPVIGFLQVDRSALEKADDATFLELRKVGALELAYHQLASMHQISTVERLTEIKQRSGKASGLETTAEHIADFLKTDRLIF